MSDQPRENLRFRLRAFEESGPCRAAFIIQWLVDARPLEMTEPKVEKSRVFEAWARRYPHHAAQTGKRSLNKRLWRSLLPLRAAGIVDYDEQWITVLDAKLLAMSAGNLVIVESTDGRSLPPSRWLSRPAAPEYLLRIQESLQEHLDAGRVIQ